MRWGVLPWIGKKGGSSDVDAFISPTVFSSGILFSSKSIGGFDTVSSVSCSTGRIAKGRER